MAETWGSQYCMKKQLAVLALGAIIILSLSVAYWLGAIDRKIAQAQPRAMADENIAAPTVGKMPPRSDDAFVERPGTGNQPLMLHSKPEVASQFGVIDDEIVLHFNDREGYEEALHLLTEAGISMRGGIRSLSMLRVELPPGGLARLEELLGRRISDTSQNVRIALPLPIETPAAGQLKAFGDNWLAALGVPQDNADWGKGVKVAVIDTGVTTHQGLNGARIVRFSLTNELVGNGHGNAVTSIIVGNGQPGYPRGIAPATEILAYQAMGEESGDAFTIAEAIVDAVDHGANVINLSLGGWGDAPAVRAAVDYAQQAGAVVVAAVGNDRLDQITYPAAYDGVIAVTAVDAGLHWAEFPNVGFESRWPDIAAPGVGLPAAYENDANIAFSGTSASAPVVSAAIAAHMSQTGSSAQESAGVVLAQANDRGEPGADPYLGAGIIDLTRIMRAEERGVYDLAISDHYVDGGLVSEAGLPVRIGVQNRGTETVNQPVLTLMLGTRDNTAQIPLTALAPGEVSEYEATIPAEFFINGQPTAIGAIISSPEESDVNPDNNAIVSAYGVIRNENGELVFVESRQE